MKLVIWTNIPSPHQRDIYEALRARGVQLVVAYFSELTVDRLTQGWSKAQLESWEIYADQRFNFKRIPGWKEAVHILPGYWPLKSLALALLFSALRIKWVHWSEPSGFRNPNRLKTTARRVYGMLVRGRATRALAMGALAREDFVKWGIPYKMISIVPYAIRLPGPVQEPQETERGVRFIFVGALNHRKGIDLLLAAFQRVHSRYPTSSLRLVGPDESDGAYAHRAQELRLDSVEFVPPVPRLQVFREIARSHVLVLPSRFDGWGMVLVEAAGVGRPVVGSDACGAMHHLNGPDAGLMFEAGDWVGLAEQMEFFCRFPYAIAHHGKNCRALADKLSPEEAASDLVSALNTGILER